MKKYINIIALTIISIFTYSCEETVNGVELPYQELLVIRAELRANEQFTVVIRKTLPPLEEFLEESSRITGVTAYIECEGKKYPLISDGGSYFSNSELIPKPGKTYKLYAEWKNHKATAETTVPFNNDSAYNYNIIKKITDDEWGDQRYEYTITADVRLAGNCVAMINAIGYNQYYNTPKELCTKLEKDFFGNIVIGKYISWSYDDFQLSSVVITKYDNPYFDYYVTREEGDMNDDVFAIAGNNIAWNIKGDGIGLFIGSNRKEMAAK